jgi:hypothetical protein
MQVEIIGETTREPLRLLHDDAVDVVLRPRSAARGERRITSFRPMRRDELICVTAATHRLAAQSAIIEADDLTAETHLTYSAVVTDGFEYDRFFRPAGRYPARLVPLAVPEAVQELVAANLGISILSKWAALPRLQRGEIAGIKLRLIRRSGSGLACGYPAIRVTNQSRRCLRWCVSAMVALVVSACRNSPAWDFLSACAHANLAHTYRNIPYRLAFDQQAIRTCGQPGEHRAASSHYPTTTQHQQNAKISARLYNRSTEPALRVQLLRDWSCCQRQSRHN